MSNYRFISLDYLDSMTQGDHAMKKEMLGMLVSEMDQEIPRMRRQFDEGDVPALAETSHRFKSTLSYIGNERLSEANARLEEQAKQGRIDQGAAKELELLERFASDVKVELQSAYDSL